MAKTSIVVNLQMRGCESTENQVSKVEQFLQAIATQNGVPAKDTYTFSHIFSIQDCSFSTNILIQNIEEAAKYKITADVANSIVLNPDIAPFVCIFSVSNAK